MIDLLFFPVRFETIDVGCKKDLFFFFYKKKKK